MGSILSTFTARYTSLRAFGDFVGGRDNSLSGCRRQGRAPPIGVARRGNLHQVRCPQSWQPALHPFVHSWPPIALRPTPTTSCRCHPGEAQAAAFLGNWRTELAAAVTAGGMRV